MSDPIQKARLTGKVLRLLRRLNMVSHAQEIRLLTSTRTASAGRGLGNPSMGFGAGLQNVPSPIVTTTTLRRAHPSDTAKTNQIREPIPEIQLPGITETLKDFAPSPANQPTVRLPQRPAPAANDVLQTSRSNPGLPNSDILENDPDIGDPARLLNIYVRRADQIGPSHRIRGIGHLGDLLIPPGWKQGDDPVNEAEARRLYAVSRSQAKEMLDQSVKEIGHLSSADQEKLTVEKNAQYQTERALDEYLLLERIKLYKSWYDHKQKQLPQKNSQTQQNYQSDIKPGVLPQPLQPPAQTSMMAYQRHRQSLVPASPHLYASSPPLSGGTLNSRLNTMMQGMNDDPLG